MWFLVIIFLLVDVHGWHVYLWVSYVPLIIVLVLGTKLKVIVARLALQIKDKNAVIIGTPLVQPNDDLFWFGKPEFVLTLLHFTLFTNAFELAFFIWVTMGSKYKGALLQEEIATFLKQWHAQVRERLASKTPKLRAPPEILSPHKSLLPCPHNPHPGSLQQHNPLVKMKSLKNVEELKEEPMLANPNSGTVVLELPVLR